MQAKDEEKPQAITRKPMRRCAQLWLRDYTDLCVVLCVVLLKTRFLVVWWTRAHYNEAGWALLARGSFLLATVCHVNSCKNIIGPVIPDRLPPLKTAATGEGMGVHINLQRIHRIQQQADKQNDNRASVSGLLYLSTARSQGAGSTEWRVIRQSIHVIHKYLIYLFD